MKVPRNTAPKNEPHKQRPPLVVPATTATTPTTPDKLEAGRKPAAKSPPGTPPKNTPRTTRAPSSPASTSGVSTPKDHAAWLPGTNIDASDSGAGGNDKEWGSPPAQVAASQPFAGQLNIPLGFRKDIEQAKAVAEVKRDDDGKLTLVFVEGDALLRAVLYEALRSTENRPQLLRMLNGVGNNLHLTLRLTTIKVGAPPTREEERLLFAGDRLLIERTMLVYEAGGVFLPDEEAKRAIRRDQAHRMRLMGSPAYQSPLRERELP